MKRSYYSDSATNFRQSSKDEIYSQLAQECEFPVLQTQRQAWLHQIDILQKILSPYEGAVYFEYAIPRMGRRIDVILLIGPAIFVLEFKVGEREFSAYGTDQVWDYALDLKNFHDSSHDKYIVPVLIASEADDLIFTATLTPQNDQIFNPIKSNSSMLGGVIKCVLAFVDGDTIDRMQWENGRYCPTPTIIEAALALYNDHTVADIYRKDASAINLSQTTDAVAEVIRTSREKSHKSICFVTGVPEQAKLSLD